jgi:hypothetical protein
MNGVQKSYIESSFLLAVLAAHLLSFVLIWFSPQFDVGTARQDLTLIIAPVTAAYFLAAVRFAILIQAEVPDPTKVVRPIYVVAVLLVSLAFLGGVVGTLFYQGWLAPGVNVEQIKIFVGAIETFMGAAFALIAEDIFRQPVQETPPTA